jgi:hypothetical protein
MLSELQLGEYTGPCMEVFIETIKSTGIGVKKKKKKKKKKTVVLPPASSWIPAS